MPRKGVPKPENVPSEALLEHENHSVISHSATVLPILLFINHPSEVEELFSGLVKHLEALFDFDYCAFALPSEAAYPATRVLDHHGWHDVESLAGENTVLDRFWYSKDIFLTSSLSDSKQIVLPHPIPVIDDFMLVRLAAYGTTIGVLIVGSNKSQLYGEREIELGTLIANPLALTIHRLLQLNELRTVSNILQAEAKEREQIVESIKCIIEGTGAEIGKNFFKSVVEHMANAIGVRYAFVAELQNKGSVIKTIAVWRGTKLIDNFSYSVEGATGDACRDKICYCCHSVTKLLPSADMQRMMRVESCWGLPLNNSSGETVGVLVVMHDGPMQQEDHIIPIMKIFAARSGPELERIRMEAELFREKERAQVTVDSIGDGVITTGADGNVDYINPVAETLTGWSNSSAKALPLKSIFRAIDEATREPILDQLDYCLIQGLRMPSTDKMVLIRKDGKEFPIASTMSPIFDRDKRIVGSVVVFSDVSELRRLISEISYQASHDELTGLVNRRELETRLQAMIQTAELENAKHALCYIDLDRFKVVNDTCGHIAGDELLKQVSSHIQSIIRSIDTAARLGGDEFAVLLQSCPIEVAENIAEKIRKVVKEFVFIWDDQTFEIGASIGVVPITSESGGVSKVLTAADSACYIAKGQGRNTVHVHKVEDIEYSQHSGEMRWVREIRRGLQNDSFCLYIQEILPLSGADDGKSYFEVLTRLTGEFGEIISPKTFIPAAERYNLVLDIDYRVIEKTFAMLSNNERDEFSNLGLCSINLSGQSLGDAGLFDYIVEQADKYHITPNLVCFEITETAAIANIIRSRDFMSKMVDLGFHFALDDFGSGLSSFGYLKNLPVDILKIDGAFVKDIATNEIDCAMVEAINRIGKVMGLRTVAEHVENVDTLNKLRSIGIDFAQGFGISKPEPFTKSSQNLSATSTDAVYQCDIKAQRN
ncbi:MAG: EAL domain-containing protein [Gammaproteobacteria bacterium]|nr:EAL domain-containing protein [Gammaproteobacteria bacterium]MDH5802836.1 EAL domain-containing protein [Gammaproteobacteria bacterium]